MTQKLFFILILSVFTACATHKPAATAAHEVYTMKTNIFPQHISRTEYYEQMAISYALNNQTEKAIEFFRLSLLHDPKNVSAYLSLADEYHKTNQNRMAIVELSHALKLEPDNLNILKKIGDIYLETKIYSKARESFEQILELNKNSDDARWALFYIYKIEKKYKEALSVLVKIKSDEKTAYRIAYEKALIYKLTKENELYNFNLNEAFSLNPRDRQIILEYAQNSYDQKMFKNSTLALIGYSDTHDFDFEISQNLAYSAVQSAHYEIALQEYNKQRPLTYDINMVDLKKAHVYYLMGSLNQAEKLYLSVLTKEEKPEARFYLAQIYITQNKAEDAAFVLSKMPTSSDYYGEAQVRLALYKKYNGQPNEAINNIRMAFIQRPDQLILYKTYADFMIENKRYVETLALLEKGMKLFPHDEDLRLKMAFLHYRLNNEKSFKKQIMAALQINPESANVYSMLAELWYLKNKNPQDVIYFVKKAAELKSTNKNIKPLLAWALMQQDNATEAVAIFEEFFEQNPDESFFARSLSEVYKRGDVKEKSKELAKLAMALETNDSLKSRFIFKNQTQQVDTELFKQGPTRLPTSLENH